MRIEEKSSGRPYSSDITIEPGKQYEVYIYYHNDASMTYNGAEYDYVGVARDVRLASNFPDELAAGERGVVNGIISSSNAEPEMVWDEAYITASEDMTLHYVEGSAKIYNDWGVNGSVLSINLFSDEGTFLGLNELNGVILGCDEYSGQVVYTIQTYAVEDDTPVEPGEPVEPTPEVPEELPNTGPLEVGLAIVILVALAAAIAYWVHTRKAVKHVTKRAKGKK